MTLLDFFLKQKEAIRARSREVFVLLRPEYMAWKPEKDALSLGEMLRHLWVSEEGVRRVVLDGNFAYFETRIPKGLRAITGTPGSLEEELKNIERVHKDTLAAVAARPPEFLDEERANEAKPIPRSRPARLKEAKRRLQEELWVESRANTAYEHYRVHARDSRGRRLGASPTPYSPPETPAGKINLTDPDSRMLKASRGYVQGYNAQAAVNENQVVIAAEVTVDSPDFGHLQPMLDAAQSELEAAGVSETPGVLLADAGYWHKEQMENVINHGIQVLIPPDAGKRKGTRPGWDGGAYAHMRRVLSTELGRALYRKRQAIIEPVFGHTKFNRRIDRFQRRGRSAARSEWRLITATHNLLKLHSHQIATAGA